MDRKGDTYQERFKLMGHSDMDGLSRLNYPPISMGDMVPQFEQLDQAGFTTFIKSKLDKTIEYYGGMYFYSLFAPIYKYGDDSYDADLVPVRLEFRGFHNVLRIAGSLADKAKEVGAEHPLHEKSVGEIFTTYVDRHMKDVHFFFDLAYKTSGFLPEYKEATYMVRRGDSLDAIIENVQQIGA